MKGSLAQQVNAQAAEKAVPLSLVIELTYRCNQRCSFCYQRHVERVRELSLSRWSDVFRQVADCGGLYCTLTGGEPFLRSDCLDLIAAARSLDFAVSIITNGSCVSLETAKRIFALGVMDVGVSFLAASARRHDYLAGVSGSFAGARAAVRALVKAGVKVIMKHSVAQSNFGEYRRVRALADAEGALLECDSIIVPAQPGAPSADALTGKQQIRFLSEIGAGQVRKTDAASRFTMLHCDAGRSVAGICPDGTVVPCILLPRSLGNVRSATFAKIWHGASARRFRKQETGLSAKCLSCDNGPFCSRCHGIAFLETGAWSGPSPSLCTRAEATKSISLHR